MSFHKAVKIGELIRNKKNRSIWLVVHRTTQGIYIVDAMSNEPVKQIYIILPAWEGDWERDADIDDVTEWEKKQLEPNLADLKTIEKEAQETLDVLDEEELLKESDTY